MTMLRLQNERTWLVRCCRRPAKFFRHYGLTLFAAGEARDATSCIRGR